MSKIKAPIAQTLSAYSAGTYFKTEMEEAEAEETDGREEGAYEGRSKNIFV
jgi:hypothetical protein